MELSDKEIVNYKVQLLVAPVERARGDLTIYSFKNMEYIAGIPKVQNRNHNADAQGSRNA